MTTLRDHNPPNPPRTGDRVPVSINQPGWRMALDGGTRSDSETGFKSDTWKVGCTLRDEGNLMHMTEGFTTLSTLKCSTNRRANFWETTLRTKTPSDLDDKEELGPCKYLPASETARMSKGWQSGSAAKQLYKATDLLAPREQPLHLHGPQTRAVVKQARP